MHANTSRVVQSFSSPRIYIDLESIVSPIILTTFSDYAAQTGIPVTSTKAKPYRYSAPSDMDYSKKI